MQNSRSFIFRSRLIIAGVGLAGAALCCVLVGIFVFDRNTDNGTLSAPVEYVIAKQVQYSFTLQNKTNRVIPKAEFWTYAPVKQTATQLHARLDCNHPYQLIGDNSGNQVLHLTFENLTPYATRLITVRADLGLSNKSNPLPQAPLPWDLKAEKRIESDHPAIRRLAAQLKTSDRFETVERIFNWVAQHLSYSGYTRENRGALYALKYKKGDCTEYMSLFVALCRASGISARGIGGYICPESTKLKPAAYHNWAEFHHNGSWQIADPQNKVLMQNQADYIAMRIIRASEDNPMGSFNRFHVKGQGLKVKMN
jgi:transglutaminase-like putative cysteine protease